MQGLRSQSDAPARVLIIDDDPALTTVLARALADGHIATLTANDGSDGLTLAREWCPSLIIVDVHMPGMDGFEFVQLCRHSTECADVPIILATGSPATFRSAHKRVGGAVLTRVLQKPFDLDELIQIVDSTAHGRAFMPA